MGKRIFCLLFSIIFLFFSAAPVCAYEPTGFEVTARNALLYCLDTEEVIYSKAADEQIYPASITKLMTAAVYLDALNEPENTEITMTQSAYNKILGTDSSVLNAKVGEVFNGKDALAAILIASAGDVVYACAEKVGGSVEGFVDAMNIKAAELGMNGTHYQNPIGLHDSTHYTTVNDIRILATYVLEKYPLVKEIVSKARYNMQATNLTAARLLVTTDYMIDSSTSYYYGNCDGVKTGFTDEAGRCFVGTASYNGYHYLSIAMNCPTVNGTRTEFTTTRNLFRWAFDNFTYKAVLDTSVPVAEIPVRLSMDYDYVSLYPDSQVKSILPKEADDSSVMVIPHLNSKSVDAPIKKGDVLGSADVMYAEQVIGTVSLIAGNDVDSNFFLVAWDTICRILSSTAFKAIVAVVLFVIVLLIIYTILLNRKSKKKNKKLKYIPYDEEKEQRMKENRDRRRKKQGRPEYNDEDEGDKPL